MTKFIRQEMPDLRGTGKKQMYYRLSHYRNMGNEEFIDWMHRNCGYINRGLLKASIEAISASLASLMSLGYSVTLDDIGTFRPKIGLVRGKETEQLEGDGTKRNAQSLEISGVNFKPSKRLLADTDERCTLESGGIQHLNKSTLTLEERIAKAVKFLGSHTNLHVSDYAHLTGLGMTVARQELHEIVAQTDSPLRAEGCCTHRTYVLAKA